MKFVMIILTTTYIISCSIDDVTISKGTKLDYIEYFNGSESWEEYYFYQSNMLEEVKNFYSLGSKFEVDYSNGKVQQIIAYRIDDNKKIYRDSIAYNSDGTINKIYKFSVSSGDGLSLSWINDFKYGNSGNLAEKTTYFIPNKEYIVIEKYYWKQENIERMEVFNGKGELHHEYFFTFDNYVNYKRNIPIYISDPKNWCKNNVLTMNWKDYYGNLDLLCRPCESFYTYNLDKLPVKIETNWGEHLELHYEQQSQTSL